MTYYSYIGIAFVVIEVVFYLYFRVRLYLAQRRSPIPREPYEVLYALGRKLIVSAASCSKSGDVNFGAKQFVKGWFKGTDVTDLSKKDIRDFLSCHIFNRLPTELSDQQFALVSRLCIELQDLFNEELSDEPRKKNLRQEFMCPATDPVVAYHRPLLVYGLVYAAKSFAAIKLASGGFKYYSYKNVRYWLRRPASSSGKIPFVFFHGITPGVLPYTQFMLGLDDTRDVFIVELPWVTTSLFSRGPDCKEFAMSLQEVLSIHLVESATFCGHSYGTMVCSWMIRNIPETVHNIILIDPMTLVFFLPHVSANIKTMRSAWNPKETSTISTYVRNYLTLREIGVAETVVRHTRWVKISVFPEDLPSGSTVVLSEMDSMLASRKIRRYLERYNSNPQKSGHEVGITWLPGLGHGGFLSNPAGKSEIYRLISSEQ